MAAVVVRRGSARLIRLGDAAAAAEAARRLNADLDTLAGRRLPARLETVIKESIRHQAGTLTAEVIVPLRSWLGDGGVVFVPAGPLASLPWAVLPDLRGRPVTVCPSASSWLAAWRRGQAAPPPSGTPLLVAGPNLEHAAREVTEIARSYPGCRPLLPEEATVGAALRALDERQPLNAQTRAVHGAAWCDRGGAIVALREDVGRHNALDKLIGALVRSGVAADDGFIAITSRCSFEMVAKAAAFGASTLVALSAPTSLAIERAEAWGLTLIAVARPDHATIFAGPNSALDGELAA